MGDTELIKALLFTDKKLNNLETEKLKNEALKRAIDLTSTSSLKLIGNNRFDVLVVQDKLAIQVKGLLDPSCKLILLKGNQTDISKIFKLAQSLNSFTILNFPTKAKTLFRAISQAHKNLLEEKKAHHAKAQTGKTLAVTSFKGGVGKSLISYNLTYHLTRFLKDNQILLIDFSRPFGASRAFLNIESKYTWNTVRPLLQENKTLSKKRLFGILNFTPFNFSLLAAPEDFTGNTPLNSTELKILNESVKENFSLILEDLSTITLLKDFDTIEQADKILIVISPEPSCIFNTFKSLNYLKKHKSKLFKKMLFLTNRIDSRSAITKEVLEDKLKINILAKIEEDTEAVNNHQIRALPFEDDSLVITQDFKNLAERIFKVMF